MQPPGTPSVDQLLVLLTVVEEGSFTGAARRLKRATSAISYAIDSLEEQLGLSIFDRGNASRSLANRAKRSSRKREPFPKASRHCARVCDDSSRVSNQKCRSSSTASYQASGWSHCCAIFTRNSPRCRSGSWWRHFAALDARSGAAPPLLAWATCCTWT